jgi:hypothetical protein
MNEALYNGYTVVGPNGEPSSQLGTSYHSFGDQKMGRKLIKVAMQHMKRLPKTSHRKRKLTHG